MPATSRDVKRPRPTPRGAPRPPEPSGEDSVWTYQGYKLGASEFTTAMVHFFRAEVQRANVWRQRLDTTTNWAVVTTGVALTIAFSEASHHGVLLLNTLLVTLFLLIEARRYRYYELWSYRIRLLETDFYAAMLVPPFHPSPEWAESLAESLLHPSFPISVWEAVGRRYRRNYFGVYLIIGLAWLGKTLLILGGSASWDAFMRAAAIGSVPGEAVLVTGVVFNGLLFLAGVLTAWLHQSAGEVLPRFGDAIAAPLNGLQGEPGSRGAWYRQTRRRRQMLALVITDHPREIAEKVLEGMHRGVTALCGTGMFTNAAHTVLMCALTITEVNHLKSIVQGVDPASFMIVTPAQEVLGKGFSPLAPES